jgi:hypothetical protein
MDADDTRSASHLNAFAHLRGPFADAARDTPLPLDAQGRAHADGPLAHPLLLATCRRALGAEGLSVAVSVASAGPGIPAAAVTLQFAPFTEAGASLPVFASDPGLPGSASFASIDASVALAGAPAGLAPGDAVELRVVEGLLGRLLYLNGAEKQRIRREARSVAASRQVALARYSALDRIGAELGVPRLRDTLAWDAASGEATSSSAREPDDAYRQRLAIFRPRLLPTLGALRALLNGDGDQAGVLKALGYDGAVTVSESNAELAIAVRLLPGGTGGDAARLRFLRFVRAVHLVKPGASLPTWSLLPPLQAAATNAMLARLPGFFSFPSDSYVARYLAEALDLLGRMRTALGATTLWTVLRAQDDAGGSRFELGLGVELAMPPAAELDAMAARLAARQFSGTVDYRLQLRLDALRPQPAHADPQGRWLLSVCGLRTIHTTATGLYLSHLPFHGLRIDTTPGTPLGLAARLDAPGDGPQDGRLFHALRAALADAATAGVPALATLSAAETQAAFAQAAASNASAATAFAAAGLRAPGSLSDVAETVAALRGIAPECLAMLRLEPAMAAALLANSAAAVAQLAALVDALRRNEATDVLPLVTSAQAVLLVVASCRLPGPATPLNAGASVLTWKLLALRGDPADAGGLTAQRGARTGYFPPAGATLVAAIATTLVRSDREDPRDCIAPYHVRADLPAGRRLDLRQFEFLMNVMQRAVPLGVVADTAALRQSRIDPGGNGQAVPFVGRRSHTWREFRQRRSVGLLDSGSQD